MKRLRPEQESEMEQIFDDEACDLNSLRLTTTTHGLGYVHSIITNLSPVDFLVVDARFVLKRWK